MYCDIYIEKKMKRNWFLRDGIFFTGSFFLSGRFLAEEEIYMYLSKITSFDDLSIFVKSLKGFFSFIIHRADRVFAVVDHVRSIPLFYSVSDKYVYISNDAEYVRKCVGDIEFEPIAVQEFTSGQVCGSDTLFQYVKSIQAGEIIQCVLINSAINIEYERYFKFTHFGQYTHREKSTSFLERQMISCFSDCIDRLINYANGRQMVLPLSAGYDSRFIALMLYKKSIKNVVCFSYGIKGDIEVKISQEVATSLKFPWVFVEYSEELWYKWYNSIEYRQYQRMACGWTSIPHFQDWPAVWMLKKEKKVDINAVFIPGHVGDSLAGSDVPIIACSNRRLTIDRFMSNLLICYYNNLQLLPKEILSKKIKNKRAVIVKRIIQNLDIEKISSPEEYADAYERWNWQEINPKFIINSVRVYEFWGYDWYLPFCDIDFIEFWKSTPLYFRYGKEKYNETVDNFYFKLTNSVSPHEGTIQSQSLFCRVFGDLYLYTCWHSIYLKLRFFFKKKRRLNRGMNRFAYLFGKKIVKDFGHYIGGINFFQALDILKKKDQLANIEL